MTPTAFSFTRAQKSFTTSKPTSASSSAVRTSFSASSTVASSSSASPWNRCLAVRKPFVSVSNIGRRETYHMRDRQGSRLLARRAQASKLALAHAIIDGVPDVPRSRSGLAARPPRLVPPLLPPLPGVLPLPPRQIVVVTEILAGQLAQLVFRRGADARLLVPEALEKPLETIVVPVLGPPGLPAPRLGAEVLLGDHHELVARLLGLVAVEPPDQLRDLGLVHDQGLLRGVRRRRAQHGRRGLPGVRLLRGQLRRGFSGRRRRSPRQHLD